MSATEIRKVLLATSDVDADLVFRQQADQFEEELLGLGEIPDSYLDLFVEVISEPRFAKHAGVWNFFIRMLTDREKLSAQQLRKIADGIARGYGLYRDERTQLLAGDFVAKACDPALALEVFLAMSKSAKDTRARYAIRVGLQTTMNALPPESRERDMYIRLYESLQ